MSAREASAVVQHGKLNMILDVVAIALLNRLLHHAVVVQIEGASYRLRQHADLAPEHVRSKVLITPQPAPKRRERLPLWRDP